MQYHGRFYPSALYRLLARINAYLVRWIRNKYRRYDATRAARRKLTEITSGYPRMFRHWRWVTSACPAIRGTNVVRLARGLGIDRSEIDARIQRDDTVAA